MSDSKRNFWRVTCHIGQNPGQWPIWFREQCCAVGWPPSTYGTDRPTSDKGWAIARSALRAIQVGDSIVASLPENRVGRVGTVVDLKVADHEWNPVVPPSDKYPEGDNGRRIIVRWDLSLGPSEMNKVVTLPPPARIPPPYLRKTVQMLPESLYEPITSAMNDESNWGSIVGRFSMERALSDYIALHPERLEGGMVSHPSLIARELAFDNRTRADVILLDRFGRTVVVECKQGVPTASNIDQVDAYRKHLLDERSPPIGTRAMLVHGGAKRVGEDVLQAASEKNVELVYHELNVTFMNSHR